MNNPYLSYYDPYAGFDFSPAGGGYNPQGDHLANLEAQRQREAEEKEQRQQSWNNFSNNMMDYMQPGTTQPTTTTGANPYMAGPEQFTVAGAPGTTASTGVGTMGGGTIPLTGAGYVAPASSFTIGGTGAGAAGAVPTGMTTMAGAPVTMTTVGQAGMAAPGSFTIGGAGGAGAGAGAGGAGAGAGAGVGAGAGSAGTAAGTAGLGAAAIWAAPVAAAIGAMNWTNNTHDDVNWGTHFTDPNKAHGALGENMEDVSTRWLGDNWLGNGVGSAFSGAGKVVAPSSPGEFVEGLGDMTGINQTVEGIGGLGRGAWDWLSGLF